MHRATHDMDPDIVRWDPNLLDVSTLSNSGPSCIITQYDPDLSHRYENVENDEAVARAYQEELSRLHFMEASGLSNLEDQHLRASILAKDCSSASNRSHDSGSVTCQNAIDEPNNMKEMENYGLSGSSSSRTGSATVETSTVIIVPEKLTGDNYREWAQSMKLALDGRGKLGYVTGDSAMPPLTDTKALQQWKSENALVSSWLLNSMSPMIKTIFMFLPSAREIWEAVREAYSDSGNVSQIFEIRAKLWHLKQGNRNLNEYYLEKSSLWQELDLLTIRTYHCADDAAQDQRDKETDRLFELLVGLNSTYDDVRGRLLSQTPLPSVREAFAILRLEESRRKTMLKDEIHSRSHTTESSALAARNNRVHAFCDHCKRQGHTKDTCWDIHGKPVDWKSKKGRGRGFVL